MLRDLVEFLRELAMTVVMSVIVSTCIFLMVMMTPLRRVERQRGMQVTGVGGVHRWSVIRPLLSFCKSSKPRVRCSPLTGTEISTKFLNRLDESSNLTGVMDVGVEVVITMMTLSFGTRVGVFGGYDGVGEANTGSGVVSVSGSRFGIGTDGTVMISWSGDGTEMSRTLLSKAGMRWIGRAGAGTAFVGLVRCSSSMFISSCA